MPVITLPATFWYDHDERMGNAGMVSVTRGRRVVVTLTQNSLANLKSDAEYYAEDVDNAPENIVASARRTVAAIAAWEAEQHSI